MTDDDPTAAEILEFHRIIDRMEQPDLYQQIMVAQAEAEAKHGALSFAAMTEVAKALDLPHAAMAAFQIGHRQGQAAAKAERQVAAADTVGIAEDGSVVIFNEGEAVIAPMTAETLRQFGREAMAIADHLQGGAKAH